MAAVALVALLATALSGCAGGWSAASLKTKLANDPAVVSVSLAQGSSIDAGDEAFFDIDLRKSATEADVARVAETIRADVPKVGDGPLVNIVIGPEPSDSSTPPNLHLEYFGMGKKALSQQIAYWGALRRTFGAELARFELTAPLDLGDRGGNRFVGVTLPSTADPSDQAAAYATGAGVADPVPTPTQWEITISGHDPLDFESDGG